MYQMSIKILYFFYLLGFYCLGMDLCVNAGHDQKSLEYIKILTSHFSESNIRH